MSLKSGNNPNLAVTEALRLKKERENSYRGKALKLFPWICGHCGREFEGKRLKELTVHHKDHNHDNNPPDGSNWELLCIYCHDNEHSRDQVADALDQDVPDISSKSKGGTNPFAGLGDLLKGKLPE
ncbi:MAG: HNH nuclease family protein [Deltaproteobacteria bacterium]|nr:MAG: HNH nuclease family protein [Deltaproteobacteria bacterium]